MTMKRFALAALLLALAGPAAVAQKEKGTSDEDFPLQKPAVGDTIPDLTVHDPSGKEVKLSDLRGHYTVLTFGCLT
jgi:cytochrome oxidase Cu insertion factor (SCO1/SenC/PrrC family)